MRFSILPRVLCSRQAATKGNTKKPADNIPNEDGSATTTDDDSSTSSNISTNRNNNSNENSRKSPPRKKYPLLYSSSSPSTAAPSKALPVRIQLALSMFMKRPIPQNWSHLVSLLRGENVQLQLGGAPPSSSSPSLPLPHDEGMKRTLARLEKSLADELTVYEAEDEEDEEDKLGEERDEMAAGGESVMELLATKAPQLVNSSAYAEMKGGGSQRSDEAELDIPVSAAKSFINRPSTGNWEHLVQLFRNENIQRFDSNKNAPHEILSVGSDLTFDDSLEAMEENNPKALSVIYESDEDYDTEDGGEGEESVVGLGLLPEMYCPDEMDGVDYESDFSEGVEVVEEQKGRHVHENDDNEDDDDQGRGAVTATDEESPEAPLAGQIDWPFPDEKEAVATAAAAAPSRAPTAARKSTTKNPPSFANTKAKAYVILWERRIRRFDQNRVNVVQKSVPHNVIRSTDVSKMAESRSKEEMAMSAPPKANNANAGMKKNKVAHRKRITRPTVNSPSHSLPKMTKADTRDEVNHRKEKRSPTNTNCAPIVTSITSTSTALWNTNVRNEVMNWENKLKSIHTDVHRVLLGRCDA